MAKKPQTSRSRPIQVVVILICIAAIIATFVVLRSGGEVSTGESLETYTDPTTDMNISYQSDLKLVPYVPPNNESVLLNLTKAEPKILVTAWYSQGDEVAKQNLEGDSLPQVVIDDVKSKFGNTYKDVNIISEEAVDINGKEGREVIFTHVSAGLDTTQRLTVIEKDSTTVVTIACQSLTQDFEQINKDYFDDIVSSIKF
jgi:hypothetical protein